MSKGEGGCLSLALVVRERESRDFAAATTKASAGEQGDDFLSHVFSFRRLYNKREARMSEPMNSHGPLAGRVAVVTGASRRAGIGYALARLAAAPSCTR
jgi:hypothetical protein